MSVTGIIQCSIITRQIPLDLVVELSSLIVVGIIGLMPVSLVTGVTGVARVSRPSAVRMYRIEKDVFLKFVCNNN